MKSLNRYKRNKHFTNLPGMFRRFSSVPALLLLTCFSVSVLAQDTTNRAETGRVQSDATTPLDFNAPPKLEKVPTKDELERQVKLENKELEKRKFYFPTTYPTTKYEVVPAGEAEQIEETITLTRKLLKQRYPNSMGRRGVHPKDHGCVQAKFTVNADIPNNYKVGVFASPGKTYDTWIRFSNATARVSPDLTNKGQGESRGLALKLMGVEGETLLKKDEPKTQDFLMINQPMFAFSDVAQYLELTRVQFANQDDISQFFNPLTDAKKKVLGVVGGIRATKLGNPLESRYFSASPFLFGNDRVAKFAVSPRETAKTAIPETPSENYLREALKQSLDPASGKQFVFDFQVQIRTSDALPIEDAASADWKEDVAPFQNVATITIDKQDFDNPLTITECEHLVFTPWHGLVEFQPLGGINRLRLGVYTASSLHRSRPKEPSGFPQ